MTPSARASLLMTSSVSACSRAYTRHTQVRYHAPVARVVVEAVGATGMTGHHTRVIALAAVLIGIGALGRRRSKSLDAVTNARVV